jgi:hypothetical protein
VREIELKYWVEDLEALLLALKSRGIEQCSGLPGIRDAVSL